MSDDEFRRRLERAENTQSELTRLLHENTSVTARINETLIDMRDNNKALRDDLRAESANRQRIEIDLNNLKTGFSAIRWLAMAIAGSAIAAVTTYIMQATGHA